MTRPVWFDHSSPRDEFVFARPAVAVRVEGGESRAAFGLIGEIAKVLHLRLTCATFVDAAFAAAVRVG